MLGDVVHLGICVRSWWPLPCPLLFCFSPVLRPCIFFLAPAASCLPPPQLSLAFLFCLIGRSCLWFLAPRALPCCPVAPLWACAPSAAMPLHPCITSSLSHLIDVLVHLSIAKTFLDRTQRLPADLPPDLRDFVRDLYFESTAQPDMCLFAGLHGIDLRVLGFLTPHTKGLVECAPSHAFLNVCLAAVLRTPDFNPLQLPIFFSAANPLQLAIGFFCCPPMQLANRFSAASPLQLAIGFFCCLPLQLANRLFSCPLQLAIRLFCCLPFAACQFILTLGTCRFQPAAHSRISASRRCPPRSSQPHLVSGLHSQ